MRVGINKEYSLGYTVSSEHLVEYVGYTRLHNKGR